MTPAQDRVVHITPMQSYRIAPSPHHLQPGAGEILKSWRADPVVWMSGCRDASFPALLVCCSEPQQFIASNKGRREYSSLRRFYPPGYMDVTAGGIRYPSRSSVRRGRAGLPLCQSDWYPGHRPGADDDHPPARDHRSDATVCYPPDLHHCRGAHAGYPVLHHQQMTHGGEHLYHHGLRASAYNDHRNSNVLRASAGHDYRNAHVLRAGADRDYRNAHVLRAGAGRDVRNAHACHHNRGDSCGTYP
jgi:hypothetical protein